MYKTLIGGLMALACGCSTVPSRPSYATLEDIAQAIVAAVKSGQPEPLKALLITDAELAATLAAAAVPEADRAAVVADVRGRLAAFESRWGRLQADIARRGVALAELTYLGIAKGKVGRSHGFEHLDGDLDIHVGNRDGGRLVIDVEECFRTPSGWRLADPEVELELRR
jgi:hypothetical protein